jgi:hypothetical protein
MKFLYEHDAIGGHPTFLHTVLTVWRTYEIL